MANRRDEIEGDFPDEENVKRVQEDTCPFCRIVRRELPAEVIFEDDLVMAFRDVNPQAPVHALVIPRRHIENLDHLASNDESLAGHLVLVAAEVARRLGVAGQGYRLVVNVRQLAGQTVHHLHLHILGGRPLHWPPG